MRQLVINKLMEHLHDGLSAEAKAAFLHDYNNMSDNDLLERLLREERMDAVYYENL